MTRIDIAYKAKRARARVIARYMERNGIRRCVCFSCGNACDALIADGLDCVAIAPERDLRAERWWTMEEIRQTFPTAFDATSGHLPVDVLLDVADAFRSEFAGLFEEGCEYIVPTGSGETILCLKLAFPRIFFRAEWVRGIPALEPEPLAPLRPFVQTFFPWVINEEREVCKR